MTLCGGVANLTAVNANARRIAAGVRRRVRARLHGPARGARAAGAGAPGAPAPGTESQERLARRVDAIGRLLAAKPPGAR